VGANGEIPRHETQRQEAHNTVAIASHLFIAPLQLGSCVGGLQLDTQHLMVRIEPTADQGVTKTQAASAAF